MLALTAKFLRQIVPPVIATLIAAVLIAGFNRAFSIHLTQPRMGTLNQDATADEPVRPRAPAATKAPVVELTTAPVIVRLSEKDEGREAAKDQARIAEAPAAAPPAPAPARRSEPRAAEVRHGEPRAVEPRVIEQRRPAEPRLVEARPVEPHPMPAPVAAAPVMAAPVMAAPVAPAPVVVAAPVVGAPIVATPRQEPVLVPAEPPMVTVPDRPRPQPQAQPRTEEPPEHGPIGTIVNTLKPSSLLARAREFGEKIEAAGNEILPNIRN